MAVDILDFVKDVEISRQQLINNINQKGLPLSANTSLLDAVKANSKLDVIYPPIAASDGKYRVRFYDADGTLLKVEYVAAGENATPPENPNYDSRYLTFKKWISPRGDNFTHIEYPIDYGAGYTVKDGHCFILIKLNSSTGLNVSIRLTTAVQVDWGDGSELETSSTSAFTNHTYSDYGDYCIELYFSKGSNIAFYVSSSHSYILGNAEIDKAITDIYVANYYKGTSTSTWIGGSCYNLKSLVVEKFNAPLNTSFSALSFKIIPNLNQDTFTNGASPWHIIFGNEGLKTTRVTLDYYATYSNDILIAPFIPSKYPSTFLGTRANINTLVVLGDLSTNSEVTLPTADTIIIKPHTGIINNLPKTTYVSHYEFPTEYGAVKSIPSTILDYSCIKTFTIPDGILSFASDAFKHAMFLENIYVPKDFNFSIDLRWCRNLKPETFVHFCNYFKNNADDTPKTLTYMSNEYDNIYVRFTNGLYELTTFDDAEKLTVFEVLTSKNWTIVKVNSWS